MKLYELTGQMIGLQSLIEDGEMDAETLSDTLEALQGDITVKAENLIGYVANLDADVAMIDTEIKRLQARKKTISNRQGSLRNYLRTNMEASGIDKITCPLFTITLRKATQAVFVADVNSLPPEYVRTTVMPDKAAIKAVLKAGEKVEGCNLIDGQRGLLIK